MGELWLNTGVPVVYFDRLYQLAAYMLLTTWLLVNRKSSDDQPNDIEIRESSALTILSDDVVKHKAVTIFASKLLSLEHKKNYSALASAQVGVYQW